MDLVIVILITMIVIWKSIYTLYLVRKFFKEKNRKHMWINIGLLSNYIIYFYFLFEASAGSIQSPLEGPLWLIIIFVALTFINVFYDFKTSRFRE
ncbi:hypothetical protein [Clostridium saccharobutylicum]|nr:hypothetical protein [Clostridium saccharobutylicum]AQR91005.1 hypothetical protein CLOSC_27260 [Clostridium saccharobutylicum]AQS00909.1 hypothetical protein CSACC_27330 [Clostridium saccharobutylicum]AQS10647.1 hypothetical protein CLOBY_27920 [Clostridium saccharobutylicum]AQS14892.1 hypothetical protein CLOSACC_27330 [Clostridium saccharobutylicum]MBA2907065.1 fatty acid desaturase [Clostridium saccharobutylicum]